MDNFEAIRMTGQTLYGNRWHAPLGRALGLHHPKGARPQIAPEFLWRIDQRARTSIPAWIPPALASVLRDKITENQRALAVITQHLESPEAQNLSRIAD
jgi:hypothetical protein